jgi:hypothetical protein
MLRIATRWMGYALLALAMIVGVFDGARSISISSVTTTPLGTLAFWLFPRHFPMLEPAVSRYLHPALWDPVVVSVLLTPAVIALFVAGGVLLALGQHRKPAAIGGTSART